LLAILQLQPYKRIYLGCHDCLQIKTPCPGFVRVGQNPNRARFAYDDLFALFICSQQARSAAAPLPHFADRFCEHAARLVPAPEVSLFVARLQNPPVLHHHA